MKKFRWDKKYLYWGITAFLVVAAAMLFYLFLSNLGVLGSFFGKLLNILSPFVWGLVIAYLLDPLMKIYERSFFTPLGKRMYSGKADGVKRLRKFSRGMAVFLAVLTLVAVFAATVWLIVPRLYQSLESMVLNSSTYIRKAYGWFGRILANYPTLESDITSTFGNVSENFVNWLKSTLLPQLNDVVTNVTSGVYYFFKGIYNVIIGIIVSVYVLYNKEAFGAHWKKFIYCIFSLEVSKKILDSLEFIDKVFIGFISGKILDSAIIGIICYVACLILRMPYSILVAFIVGITNIIPFFGPLIGAIPSAVIILMDSPIKALVFLIAIFIIQQFDGNILGPKILGSSVGVNGFWIMFSIILGAGLFGFVGMLLGVPVFVVIYTGIKALVNKKLRRSGLPAESGYYSNIRHLDPDTGEPVPWPEDEHRTAHQSRWKFRSGGGKAAPDRKKADPPSGGPAGAGPGAAEDKKEETVSGGPKS